MRAHRRAHPIITPHQTPRRNILRTRQKRLQTRLISPLIHHMSQQQRSQIHHNLSVHFPFLPAVASCDDFAPDCPFARFAGYRPPFVGASKDARAFFGAEFDYGVDEAQVEDPDFGAGAARGLRDGGGGEVCFIVVVAVVDGLFFSFCSFGPSHNRAQDIPGFAEAAREVQLRGLFVGSHDEVVGAAGAG